MPAAFWGHLSKRVRHVQLKMSRAKTREARERLAALLRRERRRLAEHAEAWEKCTARESDEPSTFTCAICLADDDVDVVALGCGHRFHMDCVENFVNLLEDLQTRCPCCRKTFDARALEASFLEGVKKSFSDPLHVDFVDLSPRMPVQWECVSLVDFNFYSGALEAKFFDGRTLFSVNASCISRPGDELHDFVAKFFCNLWPICDHTKVHVVTASGEALEGVVWGFRKQRGAFVLKLDRSASTGDHYDLMELAIRDVKSIHRVTSIHQELRDYLQLSDDPLAIYQVMTHRCVALSSMRVDVQEGRGVFVELPSCGLVIPASRIRDVPRVVQRSVLSDVDVAHRLKVSTLREASIVEVLDHQGNATKGEVICVHSVHGRSYLNLFHEATESHFAFVTSHCLKSQSNTRCLTVLLPRRGSRALELPIAPRVLGL